MDKIPFITIGIPVYNTEKYISKCLDSILNQTYTDYEILCINDGSTDGTLTVLNEYAKKDNRIRIISRENGGVAAARNAIIMNACGEYISMIDSDDYMAENALELSYRRLEKNNFPDLMYVGFGQHEMSDKRKGEIRYYHPKYPGDKYFDSNISGDERAVLLWLDETYMPSIGAKYMKRRFVKDNGLLFDTRYRFGEDGAFSIQAHRKTDNIVFEDIIQFYYQRNREGSVTTDVATSNSMRTMYSYLVNEYDFFEDLRFYNISEETRKRMADRRKQTAFVGIEAIKFTGKDKQYILEYAGMIEQYIKKDMKGNIIPKEKRTLKNQITYFLFKIIGIRNTVKLLYPIMNR